MKIKVLSYSRVVAKDLTLFDKEMGGGGGTFPAENAAMKAIKMLKLHELSGVLHPASPLWGSASDPVGSLGSP